MNKAMTGTMFVNRVAEITLTAQRGLHTVHKADILVSMWGFTLAQWNQI